MLLDTLISDTFLPSHKTFSGGKQPLQNAVFFLVVIIASLEIQRLIVISIMFSVIMFMPF